MISPTVDEKQVLVVDKEPNGKIMKYRKQLIEKWLVAVELRGMITDSGLRCFIQKRCGSKDKSRKFSKFSLFSSIAPIFSKMVSIML